MLKSIQDGNIHHKIEVFETLKPTNEAKLGPQYAQFATLKAKLDKVKSKMDKYYFTDNEKVKEEFIKFTNMMRPTNILRWKIIKEYNGQVVTRGGIKFYEIVYQYNMLENQPAITAFMNAELPGSAVCAINHQARTLHPGLKYDWMASSYAPSESMKANVKQAATILGDHYGIWEKNRPHWLMNTGADTTDADAKPGSPLYRNDGDARNLNNLIDYQMKLADKPILLYTHDAGIDVSDDPNNQEVLNHHVHFGCAMAGLLTLKPGGHFIAKQYTFFEPFTIDLIFIYSTIFQEFYISKPMSSGQSNSEIYLVGINFLGLPDHYVDILKDRLTNFHAGPFFGQDIIPKDTIKALYDFAVQLADQQIEHIEEVLTLFERAQFAQHEAKLVAQKAKDAQHKFAKIWLEKNKIIRIDNKDHIPYLPSY
jgi:FtsJ-like methyltransferase